jgi:hypothetical protein
MIQQQVASGRLRSGENGWNCRPVDLFSTITDCPIGAGGSQKSLLALIATSSMVIRRRVCFYQNPYRPPGKDALESFRSLIGGLKFHAFG